MEESSPFPFLLQLKLILIFFLILDLSNHFQAKKKLNCFKGTRTLQQAKANLFKV